MSIESRIRNLEIFFNPEPGQQVIEVCQERTRFEIQLVACSEPPDLPEEWRLAFNQARNTLATLPRLPEHRWHVLCGNARRPRVIADDEGDDEKDSIRRLVVECLKTPLPCNGKINLGSDMRARWERFTPGVPFPWQRDA